MSDRVEDRRRAPFAWQDKQAISWIHKYLSPPPLKSNATGLVVYVDLTVRSNSHRQCWPKVNPSMVESTGLSDATIRRRIKELEQLGLIAVTECIGARGDTSNTYTLLDVPESEPLPNWHEIEPIRLIVQLTPDARKPVPHAANVAPDHRRPYHSDSARTVTKRGRHTRRDSAGPITVTGPLNGELTRSIDREKEIEQIPLLSIDQSSFQSAVNVAPVPFVLSEIGVRSDSAWSVIRDELSAAGGVIGRVAAQLLPSTYLIGRGDVGQLVIEAPTDWARRQIDAKLSPDIARVASELLSRSVSIEVVCRGRVTER